MNRLLLLLPLIALGCAQPEVELEHAAYLWQRQWTPAVTGAARAPPAGIEELRVLALEMGEAHQWPDVVPEALVGRRVVAVVRVDGTRPPRLRLAPLFARLQAWRDAGVEVAGVEVDHDCASAGLGDYADWIARERVAAPRLRWSITALPTWRGAAGLPRLTNLVDEVVLQVHAVRAPVLIDGELARRDLEAFAAESGAKVLRVALPTYRVEVAGQLAAADPVELQAFVRALEDDPVAGLVGVVWFRLPVEGDRAAWARPTLEAVIHNRVLSSAVVTEAVEVEPGLYDLVVENRGNLDGVRPRVRVDGAVDFELRAPRTLRAGERRVIGWARGRGVSLAQ